MRIYFLALYTVLSFCTIVAQETITPPDIRQHNLGNFNSSILNPSFSYARNENPVLFFWGRTQWTDRQYSPETYIINYTQRINDYSAAGIGGFLHDTGLYETGGVITNYAYSFDVGKESQIALGVNVIGSFRKLHKFFFTDAEYEALPTAQRNNFTLAMMPGIVFTTANFTLGVTSENLIDYNFGTSESSSDGIIFTGHAGYKLDFRTSGTFFENGSLSAFSYVKTIPDSDTQVGGGLLVDITHGWMQAGYNNFYGPSIGLGLKVNKFKLGGVVELPNAVSDENLGATFELVIGWVFGEPSVNSRGFSGPLKKKKGKKKKTKENIVEDTLEKEENVTEIIVEETVVAVAEQPKDTISETKPEAAISEVVNSKDQTNSLSSGFYLIVNVFEEENNFNEFMDRLKAMQLDPKYFIHTSNKRFYVYLERYNTLAEATSAQRSKFNGRYKGDSWIFKEAD